MVQYATIVERSAALSTEFGQKFLVAQFGEERAQAIYEVLGQYKRGPRKGLQRGYVHWKKCTVGGWVKTGAYDHGSMTASGHVQKPGPAYGAVVTKDKVPYPVGSLEVLALFWAQDQWTWEQRLETAKYRLERSKSRRRVY